MNHSERHADPAIRFLADHNILPTDEDRMIGFLVKYGHYPNRETAIRVAEMGVAVERAVSSGTMTIETVNNNPVGVSSESRLQGLAQMCLLASRMFLNNTDEVTK